MKQMCWLPTFASKGTKILHLRLNSHEPWKPYTALPQYAKPDYQIPGGSKGWATYQALAKTKEWNLLSSNAAMQSGEYKLPADAIEKDEPQTILSLEPTQNV